MAINFSEEDKEKIKNDKSEIYTRRTEETYAEYVKSLKGKNKRRYFADYYLKFVIIAIAVITGIIFFIRDIATKPGIVLSVAIDGDAIKSADLAKFAEIIEDELNLDTEHEKADIFCVADDGQLQALLYTGGADVLIAPEEKFQKWAEKGCFMEPGSKEGLSFYNDLPEEQKYYSEYTDSENTENIKDSKETGQGQDGSKLYNCGIYLTGTDKYTNELGGYITGPVAGIVSSSENMDYAVTFLKYMARD